MVTFTLPDSMSTSASAPASNEVDAHALSDQLTVDMFEALSEYLRTTLSSACQRMK